MALAKQCAAQCNQSSGTKTKSLSSQQRCNNNISSGFELAVGLDPDSVSQIVHYQYLLSFSQTQFPRTAGVFVVRCSLFVVRSS
jgi:hypothetical protein